MGLPLVSSDGRRQVLRDALGDDAACVLPLASVTLMDLGGQVEK